MEVLPWTGRGGTDDELEAKAAVGVPGLVGEGAFLVLGVEGRDGGEIDLVVEEQHRCVVAEERWWDGADWEDCDSDHAACLDAHIGLHC